jgi:autotransporter-associated beta strand protein
VNDNIAVSTDRARISGAISGTLYEDLLKSGPGVLELSGANTYAGATLVDAGTLVVNGSSTSFLTDVRSGAILGGRGSVKGVRVQTGGTLSPGELAGVTGQTSSFTINGDLSFAGANSKVQFELATGSYDQLRVNGNVYLEGADLVGFLLGGFMAAPNDLFFLIINDGTESVQGQFAQGSSVNFGGQTFGISYSGDSASQSLTGGNDVVLSVIPEPATALLLGTGLLLLGGRRRRSVR